MTAAYEAAGLSEADIACVASLIAAVESAGSTAAWVAVDRTDVLGVVGVVDWLVDHRSVVRSRSQLTVETGRIARDPGIMAGASCVRGTRIPVAMILRYLAELDPGRVLTEFPQLTRDDLAAVLQYAAAELDYGDRT